MVSGVPPPGRVEVMVVTGVPTANVPSEVATFFVVWIGALVYYRAARVDDRFDRGIPEA